MDMQLVRRGAVGVPVVLANVGAFTATTVSDTEIGLTWVKPNELSYASAELYGSATNISGFTRQQCISESIPKIYDGALEIFANTELTAETTYYYRIFAKYDLPGNDDRYASGVAANATTNATPTSFRYGIRITKAESNPVTRVTYLYDAVGKTPAAMNMSTNVMDYGGWANAFFVAQNRPVMLKYDGTVDYELSHTDQTKKLDGVTASDVSNAAYAGNAMSEFPLIWLYEYEDTTYEYHIISNVQYDANYKAYAHMKDSTTVKDKMYLPCFGGYYDGTRLRSLADKAIMVSQTRNTEVSRATANGTGWDTITYSQWNLINVLLTLISQSTNGQVKFGTGRCKSTNTTAINTGSLKATGQFKGYNDETSDVKVFYLEGWWGNVWAGMRGMVTNASGRTLVKRTAPYNFDGTDYADTGVTPAGTIGGFINTKKVDNNLGGIAKTAAGSETTYYCDGLWFDASRYAFVGGSWGEAGLVGPACVHLRNATSTVAPSVGSSISYTPQ